MKIVQEKNFSKDGFDSAHSGFNVFYFGETASGLREMGGKMKPKKVFYTAKRLNFTNGQLDIRGME